MSASILGTIFAIALSNHLKHIIYINDGPTDSIPDATTITFIDLPCHMFYNGDQQLERYIKDMPIINVIVNCPRQNESKPLPAHMMDTRVMETVPDPLAHPMVNLMVIGSVSEAAEVASYLGQYHMMKGVFVVVLADIPSTTGCHPAKLLHAFTLVAVVTRKCLYRQRKNFVKISEQFEGFGGRNFLVATAISEYFSIKSVVNDTVTWTGYCFEIANAFAAKLDFNYTVVEPPDFAYGAKLNNGQWIGMVGMLHRKEVDMILASLTVTSTRKEVVDFTYPYMEEDTAVGIAIPKTDEDTFYIFRGLQWNLWLTIVLTILVVGILMFFIQSKTDNNSKVSMDECIVLSFGAFALQGSAFPNKEAPARIITITVQLMVVVVAASYAGILVATLATRKVEPPFTTLEGLLEDRTYNLTTEFGSATHQFLKESKTGLYARLYKRLNGLTKSGEHLKRFQSGMHTATISPRKYFETTLGKKGICNVYVLRKSVYSSWLAGALPKKSPFLPIFSEEIIRLTEYGLLTKWGRPYTDADPCQGSLTSPEDAARSISLVDSAGAFIAVAVGLQVSALILLCEKCVSKCRTMRSSE